MLLGSRGNYFQGSGEINALFSGIKGAQTPQGGCSKVMFRFDIFLTCYSCFVFLTLMRNIYVLLNISLLFSHNGH